MNLAYNYGISDVYATERVLFHLGGTHVSIESRVNGHLGANEAYVELYTLKDSPYSMAAFNENYCLTVRLTYNGVLIPIPRQDQMEGVMGEVYNITPPSPRFAQINPPQHIRLGGSDLTLVLFVGQASTVEFALAA